MEKLQYKQPLSGVPTATTGADDEDSDQQDYDHLSDEVCTHYSKNSSGNNNL